jgi:hypothetical protein
MLDFIPTRRDVLKASGALVVTFALADPTALAPSVPTGRSRSTPARSISALASAPR